MCGVAGFYNYRSINDPKDVLVRMLTRIRHRGPDESGIYLSDKIGLGSVRLSIIDLATGTMPLSNEDDSLWIVYNGEIFNFIELRKELITLGYQFKTTSDTEVILHLYHQYGTDFLQKLNGQYAIAIWNKKSEELFLARDRVGIRPLYYTHVNGAIVFGSEIKAFLEYPEMQLKLSPKVLAQYFTFWTSLTPNTAFENVFEVPPGTYMIINSKGITRKTYWELPVCKPEDYEYREIDSAKKAFEKLFLDAVKLRLRADVPIAAYLSGGLDSSVTTSFIKSITSDNLHTFSIGFTDKNFDESEFQNEAAHFFKTQHHAVTCGDAEIAEQFQDTVYHTEAPLLRTAPVPMQILAKNVRRHHIKVVITGEGADELLGGYNIFKEAQIRHFWAKQPDSKIRPLLLKKLYPYLPQLSKSNPTVLKMFFGYKLDQTDSPAYSHLLRWHNTSRIKHYLSDTYKKSIGDYDPAKEFEEALTSKLQGCDYLTKAQYIEISLFLSGYLLSSQGDRMAMANSVEGRYPFLDYRVIEFCMKLSPDLKLNGLNEKYLLKKMIKNRIPESILNRPKQAYRAPIHNVFMADEAPGYVREMLSEENIRSAGIFDPVAVKQLIEKLKANKQVSEMDHMALTAIISTQLLHDMFVKRTVPELLDEELVVLDKVIIDR